MGFKKAGSKKKVKKAPGKKGRKDDWDFEGGQFTDDAKKSTDESSVAPDGSILAKKRGPRKTQERDEYIRRGKAKIEDRKRKGQFEKKMSKKMRFGDTLRDELKDTTEAIYIQPTEAVEKKLWKKSAMSVMERLQTFVKTDLARSLTSRVKRNATDDSIDVVDDEENDDVDHEGEEEYEMDAEEYEDLNADENEVENDEQDVEDEFDETNADGEEQAGSDSDDDVKDSLHESIGQDDFDWIFNPQSQVASLMMKDKVVVEKPTDRNNLQKLAAFDDFQLYGALHPKVASHRRTPVKRIGEIGGLHKMWRCRSQDDVIGRVANEILPYLGSYADILIEGREHTNDDEILSAALLHVCNHVVRARSKVLKHNQKAKKRSTEIAMAAAASSAETGKKKKKALREALKVESESGVQDFADQGFCRPRVLILCPFRGTAMKVVESIKSILGDNTSMSNKDKFEEEFGPPDSDSEEESEDDRDSETAAGKSKRKSKKRKVGTDRPEDWKALFEGSNMDDDFKLGIQINPGQGKGTGADRGAYLRMYCDFFQSDIIVASPLGLRLLIEKNGSGGGGKLNADFLSSVEIAILHQSDVMYMQNWEHVEYIMQRTNKLAESDRGTDFSRIRPYFLEGRGAEHRQLILTTQFNDPIIQASFRAHGQSAAGCLRLKKNWGDGCISQVVNSVKQVFQLIRAPSFEAQEESRFQYFKESVLNQVLRLNQPHTLIVTPSYLSFIRVRNELIRREANAAYVSEYSRDSEISRGRSKFFHGKTDLMLFSGRAHFFRRFQLRGAQHVIFYSLPEYAHFFPEIVNGLGDSGDGSLGSDISCLVLFTQYEKMALERMVGAKRCAHILSSAKTTFMFC